MEVKKAVIPAAGLGTRFLPATKAQPKEMLPLVDKPIIQYVVEEAVASGIEDILIVTGRGKRAIEDHFDRSIELEAYLAEAGKDSLLESVRDIAHMVDIHFIRQKQPLGLGHAILQAKRHVGDEPFAVLLGDELFLSDKPALKQMMEADEGSTVLAVREVERKETRRYGIVDPEPLNGGWMRVKDLVEKPRPQEAPSRWAAIGRYIIGPEIFPILERTAPGVNGEIQLTDALRVMARGGKVYGLDVCGERYDVGDKLGYVLATIDFALRRAEMSGDVRKHLEAVLHSFVGEAAPGSE